MNLIITCSRNMEEETCDEILDILAEIGDDHPRVGPSSFSGIIWIDTKIDPFLVTEEIKKIILDEPWSIRYCHRFIPVGQTVKTELQEILQSVKNQLGKIRDSDTYRITIEKRGSEISSKEIISTIADTLPNKVSLETYDWNIMIQIMGGMTGVSVLKEEDVVSTLKVKRDLTE